MDVGKGDVRIGKGEWAFVRWYTVECDSNSGNGAGLRVAVSFVTQTMIYGRATHAYNMMIQSKT